MVNKRPHNEETEEHGPFSKKAKFSNWLVEKKKQLEQEKKALAAEKKAWDETSKKLTRVVTKSPVRLNVRGVRFETSPATLRAHLPWESSFFANMLSGEPGVDGCYYIQRDPTHFQLILNILRGMDINLMSLPVPVVEALKTEAEFYGLRRLLKEIKEVLRPIFRPGPNYSVDSDWHIATKTSSAGWDAIVIGPLVKAGVTKRLQILENSTGEILIGLGPTYIPRGLDVNFNAPGCLMVSCDSGDLLSDEARIPYLRKRISAPSIVEVQVDDNGDVYYAIDGVEQAKAFSVAVNRFYRLLVVMFYDGGQVKLL